VSLRRSTLGALPMLVALGLVGSGIARAPAISAGPQRATERAAVGAPAGQRGDFCKADGDCGWDDPCQPRRCSAVVEPPTAGCEKRPSTPGTCACVEQQCTLRPSEPTRGTSAAGCSRDDECAVDVGSATCHLRGRLSVGPIVEEGPVCTCAAGSGRCEWSWVGPVPCRSWRDCSWVRSPRLRPVPAARQKRPVAHPVKPCDEGDVDSVCGPQGACRIVTWSC
jgi:hypothetical protein